MGLKLAGNWKKEEEPSPVQELFILHLKELRKNGLIKVDDNKNYSLTPAGEEELKVACKSFCDIFYDMDDMLDFKK